MRANARTLLFGLALVGASCRCGEPGGQRAYDVGVPLGDLPAASGALAASVPGPVLAYAEAQDGRELAQAVTGSAWFSALQKSGGLQSLALSGPAATLTALVQRLNDLSRSPIGGEALVDLLDGPLAVAIRTHERGGFDLLLLKTVGPKSAGALRLAQMLEAVHPSASEVGIERHRGLPVRALRLDGIHKLHYVVLRDRLLVSTDPTWLRRALDLSLGRGPTQVQPSVAQVQQAAASSRGFALIDGRAALASPSLGTAGRALAGLSWLALRWNAEGAELGARRAAGSFGGSGPRLAFPPGTALGLAREAKLEELLVLPEAPVGGAADGGAAVDEAARALLGTVSRTLDPTLEGHVLYALGPAPGGSASHLLALSTGRARAASSAFEALVPRLFRAPAMRHEDLGTGVRCVGTAPALCWAELGPLLTLATWPGALHAEAEALRAPHAQAFGPLSLFVDPAQLAQLLGRAGLPGARRKAGGLGELEPLAAALRASRPLLAQLQTAPNPTEAWGAVAEVPRPPEPRRESRDGGGP